MLCVVAAVMFGGLLLRWLSAGKPEYSGEFPQPSDFQKPVVPLYKHEWAIHINGDEYGIAQRYNGGFELLVGETCIDPETSVGFGYVAVIFTTAVIGAVMVYLAISFLRRKRALEEELTPQPYAPR